jgi:parallel beta-helix repeat protein
MLSDPGESGPDSGSAPFTGAKLALVAVALLTAGGFALTTVTADGHCDKTVQDGQQIQSGVDAAGPGDTVCVEAGTFDENVLVTTEDLTIEGPNAGVPGDGDRGPEATVGTADGAFTVEADGVTVDGFELTGVTDAGAAAVQTSGDHDGYEVANNHIHGNELGVELRTSGDGTAVVETNLFEDNDVAQDGVAKAINTGFSPTGSLVDAEILNNTFVGHTEGENSYAIQLVAGGAHEDVLIAENTMQSSIVLNDATALTVEENTVDFADGDSTSAILVGGGVDDADITGNELLDAPRGLGVFDVFGGANGDLQVADNRIEAQFIQVADQDGALDLAAVFEDNDFDQSVLVTQDGEAKINRVLRDVQQAIDAAESDQTVRVGPGTYAETLDVDTDGLAIAGAGADEVTLDASVDDDRGIQAEASDLVLTGLTVAGANDYGVKVQLDGDERLTNVTLEDLVVENSERSEVDLNGVDGATLTDLTLLGRATSGNGLAVTDSTDILVDGLTTRNNTWGGFAIYTSGAYTEAGTSNVTLTEDNDLAEVNPVYQQVGPGEVTDLELAGYPIELTYASAPSFTFFQPDGETAVEAAGTLAGDDRLALDTATAYDPGEGVWHAGEGFELTRSVDAAADGETVRAHGGNYTTQVTLDQPLTLEGLDGATLQAPDSLAAGAAGHAAIVSVEGAEATLEGFTVAGPGPGGCSSIDAGVAVVDGGDATIRDATVTAIRDDPRSGCQSGVGVQVGPVWTEAADVAGRATIEGTTIDDFQKSAVTVAGDGNEVTVRDSTLTCAGTDADPISQDAVQVWRSASATLSGNVITDCRNGNDKGTGVHLSNGATDVVIEGNEVRGHDAALALMSGITWGPGPAAAAENIHIRDNTVEDNLGGVYLAGPASNVIVEANTVTGNSVFGVYVGPDDWVPTDDPLENVRILDNTIEDNVDPDEGETAPGVWVHDSVQATDIHLNAFAGNDLAVRNDGLDFVDARYNWWDSPVGPTSDRNPASATGATGQPTEGFVEHRPFCLQAGCPLAPVLQALNPT